MSHGCVPAACAVTAPVSNPLTPSASPATSTNTRRTHPRRLRPPITQHFHSALLRAIVMYAVTSEHPSTILVRQYPKSNILIHRRSTLGLPQTAPPRSPRFARG